MKVTDAKKVEVTGSEFAITFYILEDEVCQYEIWVKGSGNYRIGKVRDGKFFPKKTIASHSIDIFKWLMKIDLHLLKEVASRQQLLARFELRGKSKEEVKSE